MSEHNGNGKRQWLDLTINIPTLITLAITVCGLASWYGSQNQKWADQGQKNEVIFNELKAHDTQLTSNAITLQNHEDRIATLEQQKKANH